MTSVQSGKGRHANTRTINRSRSCQTVFIYVQTRRHLITRDEFKVNTVRILIFTIPYLWGSFSLTMYVLQLERRYLPEQCRWNWWYFDNLRWYVTSDRHVPLKRENEAFKYFNAIVSLARGPVTTSANAMFTRRIPSCRVKLGYSIENGESLVPCFHSRTVDRFAKARYALSPCTVT